jgi:hypothetical protein
MMAALRTGAYGILLSPRAITAKRLDVTNVVNIFMFFLPA